MGGCQRRLWSVGGVTSDPDDYIYVDTAPARPAGARRRSRRQITIEDGDWRAVGVADAPGGADGQLRTHININGVSLMLELLASELVRSEPRQAEDGAPRSDLNGPRLRVRGRQYTLVAVYAV